MNTRHPEEPVGRRKDLIMQQSFIYIMANKYRNVLYTGVTSNLIRRIYEHKNNLIQGFTSKYQCKSLVYYESFEEILAAITREKQIKHYKRYKKIQLIETLNPEWKDLYQSLF